MHLLIPFIVVQYVSVDTKQYTLSSYGALELSDKGSIEAVLGVAIHKTIGTKTAFLLVFMTNIR
jgi:hypothetical protein